MMLANHSIELNFRSRHPWRHFRVHKHNWYRQGWWLHFVWGKISFIFGQPHLEEITVCAHCYEEIQRVGEDSLNWCEGCQQVEGETKTMTIQEFESL